MTPGAAELLKKPGPRRLGKTPTSRLKRRKVVKPLTEGQAKFLERYLVHWNAYRAYCEAYPGCAVGTARRMSIELRGHPGIAPYIKAAQREIEKRYAPTRKNALSELAALGFSNIQDFYTDQGALKPLNQLPRHAAAAVKKLKSKEITAIDLETGEERVVGHERELELHDKVAALRMIGQHVGLFADETDAGAAVRDFAALLREARARVTGPRPAIEGQSRQVNDEESKR